MNLHFSKGYLDRERYERPTTVVPRRGYGRIDQVDLIDRDRNCHFVAIDLVDADWLDEMSRFDDRFSLDNAEARAAAWRAYSARLAGANRPANPFGSAPIFRLEVEVVGGEMLLEAIEMPSKDEPVSRSFVDELEGRWVEICEVVEVEGGEGDAMLYDGLFSEPVPVLAIGKMPSVSHGKALSDIFSLNHLPRIGKEDLERVLSKARSETLAVYDVGQGNANALMGPFVPSLYYDLGAGVYGNKGTTPADLRFCFTSGPVIILSHWDADHWAGAYAASVGSIYPALQRNWIAPLQVVGPVHTAFAHDIVCSGGSLHIYAEAPGVVGRALTRSGHWASFTAGSGKGKNGSGIVLAVENEIYEGDFVSWLLTGDCDYGHFMHSLKPSPPVGLIAPHHGADLHAGCAPPRPADPTQFSYRRLVYSFGKDNKHGRTKVVHPTQAGVLAHEKVGWQHNAAWLSGSRGAPVQSGGDILATCEHSPDIGRGSVIVGWISPPVPTGAACGGTVCTLHIGAS